MLLLILNIIQNTATDRRWARLHSNTPPAIKTELLSTLSSSFKCESAAVHNIAEQYSKPGGIKIQKSLRRSGRTMKYLPGLAHKTKPLICTFGNSERCISNVILASNVTPNITRSADSFSTVPSRVNGGLGDELCSTWKLYQTYSC